MKPETACLLVRTFDADWLNELANDPEIRPFIGGGFDEVDLSSVVNSENIILRGDHGGFALGWSAPGVYEVHTFIRKEGRGRWSLQAAQDMIAMMKAFGANRLWTQVEKSAANVRRFAKVSGMKPTGLIRQQWGKDYDVLDMVL